MKHNLKAKIGNLLLIGGIAYILLRLGYLFDLVLLNLIMVALHLIWIAFFMTILFKKQLVSLDKFNADFPSISLFLKWIGCLFYFNLPKMIMLMNGECEDYTNTLISSYFEITTNVPWIIFPLGVLAALRLFIHKKRHTEHRITLDKNAQEKSFLFPETIRTKIYNLLIIGGIVELLLQVVYLNDNFIFDYIASFIYPFFIISIIVILSRQNIIWINNFSHHFQKTGLFLKWIGILPYLSFPIYAIMLNLGYERVDQIYGDQNISPVDFVTIYGAILQILEYIFYSLGFIAVIQKFYYERKAQHKCA